MVDKFVSLVNPEKPIQPFVVNLTGINNKMLRNAPKFHEVAKRIIEITEGCVLIAHNTSFDYRILRTEFDRLGYNFERKTLCTVQLSKKLFPEQESYSLGKLCKSLGIPFSNRHRAEGDTDATVKLFEMLLFKDVDKEIVQSAIKPIATLKLASKLQQILDSLPTKAGVFYMHNANGKILYIGKHNNIKRVVNNLFLREAKKIKKLISFTETVTFELLGNDLMNQLKFHKEVALHKPTFNKRIKPILNTVEFSNKNMIIVDKGRNASEHSVILIENNNYIGNTFVDLNYQINNIDILHNLITKEEDNNNVRLIIKQYLQKNKVQKIIRF